MKTKLLLLKWLMVLLLLGGATGAWAQQPFPLSGGETVCLNTTHNYGVINTTGSTYAWSILPIGGGTITGNGNNIISVLWQATGPFTLQVIETTQFGCPGTIVNIPIIVNDLPVVAAMTPPAVCSGNPIGVLLPTTSSNGLTLDSWDITSAVVAVGLTGTATTGNGIVAANAIASDVFTNTTNGPLTVVYTVVPHAGTCVGAAFTITVTITPAPVVAAMTPPAVCSGNPIGVLLPTTSSNGLTLDSWDITSAVVAVGLTGTATTGNGIVAANAIASDVFTNTTNGPLTVVYTVVPHAGTCVGAAFTITVTITPAPVVAAMTPPAVCSGNPIGVLLPTTSSNGLTLDSWDITSAVVAVGLTGTATTGNGIVAANAIASDVFTNTTNGPLTVVYTVVPHAGTCVGAAFTITVTITPAPVVAAMTPPAVCSGNPIGVLLPTTSSNGLTLDSWDITSAVVAVGLTGTATTGNGIVAANAIASDVFTNTTNGPLTVVYTVVPHAGTCVGAAFTITVTITPAPVVAAMTPPAVCSGNPIGVLLPTTSSNGLTLDSWDITSAVVAVGLTGTATTGNGIVAANAIASDVFTNTTNGPLTVVYTVVPHAGTCVGAAFTITVTITPAPVVAAMTPPAVCSGNPIGVLLPTTSSNGLTLDSWDITSAVVAVGLTGTATTGNGIVAANAIASDVFTNTTNGPLTVVYTVVPHAGTCVGAAFTITVTITPAPVVAAMTPPAVCSGNPIGVLLPTTSSNGLTLDSWDITSAVVAVGLTGTATTGNGIVAANAIASDVFTNTTNGPLTVVYTVVPHAGTCVGAAFTITVTITPAPVVAAMTPPAVCSGNPIGVLLPTTSSNGLTLDSWDITSAVVAVGLTGTATTGNGIVAANAIASDVFTNTTNGPLTVVYTVVPHAGTCAGAAFTITVTINPAPVVAAMTPPAVCSGNPIGVLLPTTSSNGLTLDSWDITSAVVAVGLTGTATTGNGIVAANAIASDVFTNTTNGPLTVVYTVVPHAGTCVGAAFTITVTITPAPVVAAMTPPAVCSGNPIGVLLPTTSSNGLTLDSWDITSAVVAVGLTGTATTGNGIVAANAIASDVFTNTTNGPLTVVYTVVPHAGTCAGAAFTITVTINPAPVVADMTDEICSGNPIGVVLPTLSTSGITLTSWDITAVVPVGITGTATQGIGIVDLNAIAADVFTNTTSNPLTVVYTVTPHAGTCVGASFTISVTINPALTTSPIYHD